VEYFSDRNFHLHIGFLQKFQNFICNKKFLQILKSYPIDITNQEENGVGVIGSIMYNSDNTIKIEKSKVQKV